MFDIKHSIKLHALENPDQEVCGIIFLSKNLKPTLVKCKNVHPDPQSSFRISLDDIAYVKRRYKIISLYHSHPKSNCSPSPCDMNNSDENGYPMYIYSIPNDDFFLYRPIYDFGRPIKGRPFVNDINTCLTCFLDFFVQKYGCKKERFIHNFCSASDPFICNTQIINLINNSSLYCPIKTEEVDKSSDVMEDDILLMDPGFGNLPYHIGIASNKNTITHHLINRLSSEEPMRDLWTMSCKRRFRVIQTSD